MKLWKMVVALSLITSVNAKEKVIYGNDDRLDLFEVGDSLLVEIARATAAQIDWSRLEEKGSSYQISSKTLMGRGICEDQRFADQITAANCSGFLVAPDLLVTAGHCMRSQYYCDKSAWVFDYAINTPEDERRFKSDDEGDITFDIDKKQVYRCKEILDQTLDRDTQDDYALIRLDRKVEDRQSLVVRQKGKIFDGTSLVVIGHPTGLPTKVAGGASVRKNDDKYFFVSNLDTFGGNSGSPVLDVKTGIVEGILVRGEADYDRADGRSCRVPKQCADHDCRGEDVTRVTNVKKLMEILADHP